jgi:hypothetical protein
VCDGLTGLPAAIGQVWPQTIVQSCVVHLLRNSFRYASRKDWPAIAKDLKPVYTAPSEQSALGRFAEFSEKWEAWYPAIIRLWTNAWAEFVPFPQFDTEIRTIICTTNAIESINAGSGARSTPAATSPPSKPPSRADMTGPDGITRLYQFHSREFLRVGIGVAAEILRVIHEGGLMPVRRVDMSDGPFVGRIGLPRSTLTKTDCLTCIRPPVFLGTTSQTCAR